MPRSRLDLFRDFSSVFDFYAFYLHLRSSIALIIIIIITKLLFCSFWKILYILSRSKCFQNVALPSDRYNKPSPLRTGATISRNDINVTTHPSRNKGNVSLRWTTPATFSLTFLFTTVSKSATRVPAITRITLQRDVTLLVSTTTPCKNEAGRNDKPAL